QTALAQVITPGRMIMEVRVPEKDFFKIYPGQKVVGHINARSGRQYQGVVKRLSPVIDRSTRTAYAEVLFENRDLELTSGMFAKIEVLIKTSSEGLVLFEEAIRQDEDGE